MKQSVVNKLDDLGSVFIGYEPDTVITETWLSQTALNCEVLPPCYTIIRRYRDRGGGGAGLQSCLKNASGTQSCLTFRELRSCFVKRYWESACVTSALCIVCQGQAQSFLNHSRLSIG